MKSLNLFLFVNLLLVTGYLAFNFNQHADENKLNLEAIEKINREIKLLKSDIVS